MDVNRLLMMIVNPILRRLITRGVDAGINRFAGPSEKAPKAKGAAKGAPDDTAKRLRQAMRIGRKLW